MGGGMAKAETTAKNITLKIDPITSNTFPIEVEFKNIKTMRLTVYPPDGRVKIAVPFGTAPELIKRFATSKTGWIEEHRKKFRGHSANLRPEMTGSLKNHSTVFVWGKPYRLELIQRNGNAKITIVGEYMKFCVRPDSTKAKKQEVLDRWYRRILKEAAPVIIEKWEAIMGLKVQKLYVRKMKSHWGSCNYKRQTLRLNSELAKRNPECLEYVIVHEMLHIIEKGHNRNFYRMLEKHMPGWKTIRKKMNSGEMM
jgi:predicted metal-dependent hydrolase